MPSASAERFVTKHERSEYPAYLHQDKEDVKCDVLFPFTVEGEPLTSCISIRVSIADRRGEARRSAVRSRLSPPKGSKTV